MTKPRSAARCLAVGSTDVVSRARRTEPGKRHPPPPPSVGRRRYLISARDSLGPLPKDHAPASFNHRRRITITTPPTRRRHSPERIGLHFASTGECTCRSRPIPEVGATEASSRISHILFKNFDCRWTPRRKNRRKHKTSYSINVLKFSAA